MKMVLKLILLNILITQLSVSSSSLTLYTTYKNKIELESNQINLLWTVDEINKEIVFEYHVKTTGWIALGISPGGGMTNADIGIGWIDQKGNIHFKDCYAFDYSKPMIDKTTNDWFPLNGREEDGWTIIQFKRLLNTCDQQMDVQIKSGTNILIFAYGLNDPDLSKDDLDISYHENRRGTRMVPLRSYINPPDQNQFQMFESFDFRLNNYKIPSTETTYYCQIFQIPSHFQKKRHIIGYEVLIDSISKDFVHHLTTYECDSSVIFNDNNNLPSGLCDDLTEAYSKCMSNVANGWAVGGDQFVEYPEEAGYPIGRNSLVKYFMLQIHFDNSKYLTNRYDNSGIRYFIGNELRRYDLGYLTLGVQSGPAGIAIPPNMEQFSIDAFCPSQATQKIPVEGIRVISSFPHTHIQGKSVWTKLIRNGKAIDYLFNAESFNFNYQFENRLSKPIELFQNDTFITRCVYQTKNKNEITLGGQGTREEMCSHSFTYYPRINNFFLCISMQSNTAWKTLLNNSSEFYDTERFINWLKNIQWTPQLKIKWQIFYQNSSRRILFGGSDHFQTDLEVNLPEYEDFQDEQC